MWSMMGDIAGSSPAPTHPTATSQLVMMPSTMPRLTTTREPTSLSRIRFAASATLSSAVMVRTGEVIISSKRIGLSHASGLCLCGKDLSCKIGRWAIDRDRSSTLPPSILDLERKAKPQYVHSPDDRSCVVVCACHRHRGRQHRPDLSPSGNGSDHAEDQREHSVHVQRI